MPTAVNFPRTIISGSDSNLGAENSPGVQHHSEKPVEIALLTGGIDKPYAIGLTSALTHLGIRVNYIGSNDVDGPELHKTPLVRFLNFRGDQSENVEVWTKVIRVIRYYGRLMKYAAAASPPIFHILWNNRFEFFDRTLLMLYYRALGKRIVLTAHNINAAKRDGKDSWLNRLTLRIQYLLANHIFVHTKKMEHDLLADFKVPQERIGVIPFGLNETFPSTALTTKEARERLHLPEDAKIVLFFGRIAPYKGLEYLVSAFTELARKDDRLQLIIAGKIEKGCSAYWDDIHRSICANGIVERTVERTGWIPDDEVEVYFMAADVVVIPYTNIFQSGVPFLAYSFGLPVIATDVGSLTEAVMDGKTGYICKPHDSVDLAKSIEKYFSSELFKQLELRRPEIRNSAKERHSWASVAEITRGVYAKLVHRQVGFLPSSRNPTLASS
jgi:glycosyltransferase involved in cell wall biosynthesis